MLELLLKLMLRFFRQGVYRINGVKNRVDKVRILFENQSFNIDLSQYSPHDISGVLKLFLRELPEPLLHFELYDEFLQIAKVVRRASSFYCFVKK